MAKVVVESLTKTFGKTIAVNNVSVTVEDQQFLSILGPSGCGKTTLLRMIAGLEYPDSGSIFFDDTEVTDLAPADRKIGMVFENLALFPHMTVYGNISYPLRVQKAKLPRAEIDKKVLATLELVNIPELKDRLPKQLSGGQKQRVAIARAIVTGDSRVYLFDEGLANLDAKLRARMRGELKRLQRNLGLTTVFVTHDQVEAMSMADKILLMDLGRVQQFGSSHQLYDTPDNIFVAGFIGTPEMNFIDCELKEEREQVFLVAEHMKLAISRELMKKIDKRTKNSALVLGCRPADLILHRQASQAKYALEGTVFIYEPLGAEQIVEVKVGARRVRVVTPADLQVELDEWVSVEIPEGMFHVFDKNTGLNISVENTTS